MNILYRINANFQSCTSAFQIILNKNNRVTINSAIEFGGKYIYIDRLKSPKYRAMCEKYITKLVHHSLFMIFVVATTSLLIGLCTMIEIVIYHRRVTPLGTELPFFEKDSIIGYLVRLFSETLLGLIGTVAIITNEIGAALASNAYSAIPDIINIDAGEIESELHSNGMSSIVSWRLRNVIMKIQVFYR